MYYNHPIYSSSIVSREATYTHNTPPASGSLARTERARTNAGGNETPYGSQRQPVGEPIAIPTAILAVDSLSTKRELKTYAHIYPPLGSPGAFEIYQPTTIFRHCRERTFATHSVFSTLFFSRKCILIHRLHEFIVDATSTIIFSFIFK